MNEITDEGRKHLNIMSGALIVIGFIVVCLFDGWMDAVGMVVMVWGSNIEASNKNNAIHRLIYQEIKSLRGEK